MNLEQIETIIAKNLTITDQRLMDGVIGAVLDAVAAEREECAKLCLSLAYDDVASHFDEGYNNGLLAAAAAIRVREPQ